MKNDGTHVFTPQCSNDFAQTTNFFEKKLMIDFVFVFAFVFELSPVFSTFFPTDPSLPPDSVLWAMDGVDCDSDPSVSFFSICLSSLPASPDSLGSP